MMDTQSTERLVEVFEEHLDYSIDQMAQFAQKAATLRNYIFSIRQDAIDEPLFEKYESVRLKDEAALSSAEYEVLGSRLPVSLKDLLRDVLRCRRDMIKATKQGSPAEA